ncbi:TonB-dependent siderophore receptor [Eilatimonas milleporae]|nr:TonB-dependent receptor [Eilatimonas milleporae]
MKSVSTSAFVRSMACAAWMAALTLPSGALAAQSPETQPLEIAAQPLDTALVRVGRRFGVTVIASETLTAGKDAPALSGRMTVDQALGRLLAGTGLVARRSQSGVFVVTGGGTAAPAPGRGGDDAPKNTRDIELIVVVGTRESGYTSTVQSGGTFGEQSIFDTPFSVTVIPQEVLIDQQVRGLGDIARNDPSTIVSTPPGFNDTVNIRGYNLNNSSSYRRENLIFQNQVQSPFENKAAVEIVKGPTSVRYGFTPPGGVVNYALKRPTEETYRFAQAFGDSNGSYGIHVDLGGKVNDEIGFRLNAVTARESAFVEGVDGPRHMFSAFFEWTPTERLRIDLEGEYQYRELEQQPAITANSFDPSLSPEQRRDLLERFDPSTFIGQDWGTYPTSNFVGSFGVRYDLSDTWTFTGRIQKMRLVRDQQAVNILEGSLQADGSMDLRTFFDPSQVRDPLSAEAFVTGTLDTAGITHDIAFGGALSRNPLRFSLAGDCCLAAGTSNIFTPVDLPLPDVTAGPTVDALYFNQEAIFISDLITLTDSLRILAAARWSRQENRDRFNADQTLETTYEDSIIVPNFGILYNPVEQVTLYASYSQGITTGVQIPGTAANFGLDSDSFLDPAETEQFEIGLKAELFEGAILTAAYFDISQPLATFDENNVFDYIGDQDHRGVEVSLSGDLTDTLRIIAGGLYLDPVIRNPNNAAIDGNRPGGVPEHQYSLFVDYRTPFIEGLALNGGVFYTGERFADEANTFVVDDYVRIDLGLRYAFEAGGQRLTARLNVRNVADENFIEGTAFGQFLFGSPRAAFFSLATEF